jgi:hypothetical protein
MGRGVTQWHWQVWHVSELVSEGPEGCNLFPSRLNVGADLHSEQTVDGQLTSLAKAIG